MKFTKAKGLRESLERKDDPIAEYRRVAHLDESVAITDDNFDDFAFNSVCCKYSLRPADFKRELMNEAVTIDQAARDLEAQEVAAENKNQVEKVLDTSLARARRLQRKGAQSDFPNVLLVSDAGFGKTDMVRQWASKNGINLVQKNLGTMGPEAFGGIIARDADDPRYATRLGTNEMIKALEKPNSVLFLDEYNRSKTEIRGAVLTLVQNHMVWDPTEPNGEKFLDNFLFTIAAINPPNASYKGAKELDPAEQSRYFTLMMTPDPIEHLEYLTKVYTKDIEEAEDDTEKAEFTGRLALAKAILTSPKFTYDNSQDIENHEDDPRYKPLNYRSFKLALDFSDGTKEDFLSVWNHYCNYDKKPIIEGILKDYKNVDDKANQALAGGTTSDVFTSKKSFADMVSSAFPELGIK